MTCSVEVWCYSIDCCIVGFMQIRSALLGAAGTVAVAGGLFAGIVAVNAQSGTVPAPSPTITSVAPSQSATPTPEATVSATPVETSPAAPAPSPADNTTVAPAPAPAQPTPVQQPGKVTLPNPPNDVATPAAPPVPPRTQQGITGTGHEVTLPPQH